MEDLFAPSQLMKARGAGWIWYSVEEEENLAGWCLCTERGRPKRRENYDDEEGTRAEPRSETASVEGKEDSVRIQMEEMRSAIFGALRRFVVSGVSYIHN